MSLELATKYDWNEKVDSELGTEAASLAGIYTIALWGGFNDRGCSVRVQNISVAYLVE